ncbi:MAG: hypothetical protein M1834_008341 [Cirrosporium novae-zelandiae]|nr:MAG: hypothetical protein M1834_008341 [Cirrosporium novae-zelandiae]
MPNEDPSHYTYDHNKFVLSSREWHAPVNSTGCLLDSLKPNMKILDVGYGPGIITAGFTQWVPQDVLEHAQNVATKRQVLESRYSFLAIFDNTLDVVQYTPPQSCSTWEKGSLPFIKYDEPRNLVKLLIVIQYSLNTIGILTGEPDAGSRLHAYAKQTGFERENITTKADSAPVELLEPNSGNSGKIRSEFRDDRLLEGDFLRTTKYRPPAKSSEDVQKLQDAPPFQTKSYDSPLGPLVLFYLFDFVKSLKDLQYYTVIVPAMYHCRPEGNGHKPLTALRKQRNKDWPTMQ